MKFAVLCAAGFMFSLTVFADDVAERGKLNGAWQSQDQSGTAAHAVWTLEEQGSGMRITNSQGDKKLVEFVCDLAKECEVRDAGKKVKVTVFFNGPKLVVMETRGDQVFKRRFSLVETGDVME